MHLTYSFGALALSTIALAKPLARDQTGFTLAPVIALSDSHAVVNNSYIVVLKDGISTSALFSHYNFLQDAHSSDPLQGEEGGLKQVYDGQLKGYAGTFSEQTIQKIRSQPEVDYVEQDQIVHTMELQRGAPWGLARISHQKKLSFGTFTKYLYDPRGGEGVDVYVIDTGINIHHVEFEGRAKWGKTIPQNDIDEDGNGHGTHCAGTIASRKYGVAKGANVIAVKVLGTNGSGTMSDVVSGVLWAAEQAAEKAAAARAELAATGRTSHKGSVANMSLGGGKSRALDDAVNKAVDSGLHFAVAAGNDNRDACDYSPAGAEKAVTVGASTIGDERAYFSNHGPCVDVFAPGLSILSTWKGSDHAVNTISGTSMASPHVAGLLAYFLSIYPSESFDPKIDAQSPLSFITTNPTTASLLSLAQATLPSWIARLLPRLLSHRVGPSPLSLTPAELKKALIALSTEGALSDLPAKTVNKLVFNNATSYY